MTLSFHGKTDVRRPASQGFVSGAGDGARTRGPLLWEQGAPLLVPLGQDKILWSASVGSRPGDLTRCSPFGAYSPNLERPGRSAQKRGSLLIRWSWVRIPPGPPAPLRSQWLKTRALDLLHVPFGEEAESEAKDWSGGLLVRISAATPRDEVLSLRAVGRHYHTGAPTVRRATDRRRQKRSLPRPMLRYNTTGGRGSTSMASTSGTCSNAASLGHPAETFMDTRSPRSLSVR